MKKIFTVSERPRKKQLNGSRVVCRGARTRQAEAEKPPGRVEFLEGDRVGPGRAAEDEIGVVFGMGHSR